MRKFLILLLGAILIGILSYFCFLDKAGSIKDDLVSKAQGVYGTKQMDWVKTGIKGDDLEMTRILTLEGIAPSETLKAEAGRMALAQLGVDGVENNLIVATTVADVPTDELAPSTTVPAPSPYEIDVQKTEDSKITLSGYVSNAKEHKELIAEAKSLFGVDNVSDALKEHEGAPIAWYETAKLGLSKLTEVDYGEFKVSNQDFYFKGHLSDASKKESLTQAFEQNLYGGVLGHYEIDTPELVAKVKVALDSEVQAEEIAVEKSKQIEEEIAYSCQDEFRKILTGDKIHFEYNKSDIKSSSHTILNDLVAVAKQCAGDIVSIEGHTDSIGTKIYNQALSTSRADAVKDYLISKGVATERLQAVGYGESKPIADNMLEAGRSQNRRIEFHVIDKKSVPVKKKTVKHVAPVKLEKKNKDIVSPPLSSCQVEFRKVLSKDTIYFANSEANILEKSYKLLDNLVKVVEQCPDDTIYIEGHTDALGSEVYNKMLSTNRARAVRDYLVRKGIDVKRLKPIGYGESKPIADNGSIEGRTKNRRIEFNIKGVK